MRVGIIVLIRGAIFTHVLGEAINEGRALDHSCCAGDAVLVVRGDLVLRFVRLRGRASLGELSPRATPMPD